MEDIDVDPVLAELMAAMSPDGDEVLCLRSYQPCPGVSFACEAFSVSLGAAKGQKGNPTLKQNLPKERGCARSTTATTT